MKSSRELRYILDDTWPRPYLMRQFDAGTYDHPLRDLRSIVRNNTGKKLESGLDCRYFVLKRLLEIYPGT